MKSKIIYVILIIIAVWYAILYNTYASALALIGVIVLPVFMFVILIDIYRHTFVTLSTSKEPQVDSWNQLTISKNEKISFYLIVKNKSIFPILNLVFTIGCHNGITKSNLNEKRSLYIDSKNVQCYELTMDTNFCGNLNINLVNYRISDYLNLFGLKKKCKSQLKVCVLPELFEIPVESYHNISTSGASSDQYSTIRSGDDTSEVFGLREYKDGDKLQKIHWKLSMKKDDLIVKEFSEPITINRFILIDFFADKSMQKDETYKILSAMIETALSISYSLILNEIEHYIIWFDCNSGLFDKRKIGNEEDLYAIMELLLTVKMYAEQGKALDYKNIMNLNEHYTHMYYVTDVIDSKVLKNLYEINLAQKKIVLEVSDLDYDNRIRTKNERPLSKDRIKSKDKIKSKEKIISKEDRSLIQKMINNYELDYQNINVNQLEESIKGLKL